MVLEQLGDYDSAIRRYDEIRGADLAGHSIADARLAVLYCRKGDYYRARTQFALVCRTGETDDTTLFYRGLTLINSGGIVDGIRDWELLIARHPHDVGLLSLEPDERNRVLLLLLYASGVRRGELAWLRWRDLQATGEGGQITVFGKGGETRSIQLPDSVWKRLQKLRG
jgi:hypothetical protein